jgi:MFS family permease
LHAAGFLAGSFAVGYLIASLLNLFLGGLGWRCLFIAGIVPAFLTAYIRMKLKEPVQFELMKQYKQRLRAKPKAELSEEEAAVLKFTFPQLFKGTNLSKTLLVTAISSSSIVGYWAVLSWIPPWINKLTGTEAIQERSVATIILNIGGIISCQLVGILVSKFGRRTTFFVCFLGALICSLGMFLTNKSFDSTLLIWIFFEGFFAMALFSLMFIYVPEIYETKLRATAFGFCVQSGRIAAAIAALTGGQLIGIFGGSYAMAGATISLFYLVGVFASLFIRTPKEDLLHASEANVLPLSDPIVV